MSMRTILRLPLRPVTLAVILGAGLALSGCSEMNTVMNDVKTTTNSKMSNRSVSQQTNETVVSSETDLVGLLGWFENSCGFNEVSYTEGTKENQIEKKYKAFQEAFMAKQYKSDGNYKAYVKPDYRKNLPAAINNAIKDITVVQDNEGVHYYVDFNNATYRGYDLSRLELFYQPESDYVYDVLYFKNDNFMRLKPIFKTITDNLDTSRGGYFNAQNRSVMCYLGL